MPKLFINRVNNSALLRASSAFTIVELLVVIVVIGILASITIVSYIGISQRAILATYQSDLTNASKQLKLYQATYESYPTALDPTTKCPTLPVASNVYCINISGNNAFTYTSDGTSYFLSETNSGTPTSYVVSNNASPYELIPGPITFIAAIVGTPQISQTLTAGATVPLGAKVSYQ